MNATNAGHLLVIEDDPNIERVLRLYLEQEGFDVQSVPTGQQGLKALEDRRPDLILLDLMLPDADGWDICREIRHQHNIPIIMVTARDAMGDKLTGLELGADDYITKPFEPQEVVARIKAVLRRSQHTVQGPLRQFNGLTIDFNTRRVTRDDEDIHLTAKEFELLWLLANNPGRVFTRDQLLDRIWGYEFYGNIRTVDVHIRHLREKLEPNPNKPQYIVTLWGVGYKFEPGEEEKTDT